MNFGTWIIVAFAVFATFIATLVTICVKQDISLVRPDYYQEELIHQQKMTFIQNTKSLTSLPNISVDNGVVGVSFSDFGEIEKGELLLLRPSDPRLDRRFSLHPIQTTHQQFNLRTWSKGLYRASMQWTMNGKEFYYERLIVL